MKFGYFTHMPWPEGVSPKRVLDEVTEQVQVAESLGFYSAWLAEHHFTRYSIGSSSLIVATHIAAKTSKIRLGTAVLVSPLHNPIRLAEDTATLDVVSGGRLDVGFGRGTYGYEYGGFGVDPEESQERFRESLNVIQGLWTIPDFSFHGNYFDVSHLNLVPTVIQEPHPPVYIAASRTQDTLDFAVSTGHSLCVAVVQDTAASLDICRRFVQQSAEAGFNVPKSRIPFFRYIHVSDTEYEARQNTMERLNWVVDIMQWRNHFRQGSEVYQRMADWRSTRSELPATYDYLAENRAFIGTPDQCAAKIQQLRDEGIEYFGCNFDFGGMEHAKVLRSMDLFAKEVMPRFN